MKKNQKTHFSHSRHTGRRLPHHHTSFPTLVALLLVTAAILFGSQQKGLAESLRVSATVAAPIPSEPAAISTPGDGTMFDNTPNVVVRGSCPVIVPAIIVSLWRDDVVFVGSATCSVSGTFEIPVRLIPGVNSFTPRLTTITKGAGIAGKPIVYTLSVPVQPTAPPLVVTSKNQFIGYRAGEVVSVSLNISGGYAPYLLTIDWGDGNTETVAVGSSGITSINHTFSGEAAKTISFTLEDQLGSSSSLSISALHYTSQTVTALESVDAARRSRTAIVTVPEIVTAFEDHSNIWTAYGGLVLTVVGFWIGTLYQGRVLLERAEAAEIAARTTARRKLKQRPKR